MGSQTTSNEKNGEQTTQVETLIGVPEEFQETNPSSPKDNLFLFQLK
jgi:hypothetical protein